jgi:hypothetical protein
MQSTRLVTVVVLNRIMRSLCVLLVAFAIAGCCTRSPETAPPISAETSSDAQSVASLFIASTLGACGTRTGAIHDRGDYWVFETVFGLGERPGPRLRIDKSTRRVTILQDTTP